MVKENGAVILTSCLTQARGLKSYYPMLGGAYTRMRRKEMKDNEIYGWFALYGWMVIAEGRTRDIAEKAVQSLLTPDTYDRVVYFEVKQT